MKRLLLASAALTVLTISLAAPVSAQSRDTLNLKSFCNPALGIKCGSGTIKKKPVQTAPVVRAAPKVQVIKPKVGVATPKVTAPARVFVPQQVAPKVKPQIRIVTPQPVAPRIKVPKVKIAVPTPVAPKPRTPQIVVPGVKIAVPQGKPTAPGLVITPGAAVSIEDLRKRLAGEVPQGGGIKVAPVPGVVPGIKVAPPAGIVDLADRQVQADLVALRDLSRGVVAAAGLGDGAVRVIDRTLTLGDVRLSSQDFGASGAGKPATLDFSAVDLGRVLQSGDRVVTNTGDRMIVENQGVLRVLRDDDVLLNQPGTQMKVMQFQDGSTRNVMAFQDGTQVETVQAPDGRVLRRTSIQADGTEVVLFDDTQPSVQVMVNQLPETTGPTVVAYQSDGSGMSDALTLQNGMEAGRSFSLAQVRDIDAVRHLAPGINIDTINFASGSAAIRPEEAEELAALAIAMLEAIALDPSEVFLIEGHTDAVGADAYNLGLSDRRAESVALALIEYFGVPPQNMVLQGYGESDLLVASFTSEAANRRAAVRRITPLLAGVNS